MVQIRINQRHKEIPQYTDQKIDKPEKTTNGRMIQFFLRFSKNFDMRSCVFRIQIENIANITHNIDSLRTIWGVSQMALEKNAEALDKNNKPNTRNKSKIWGYLCFSMITSLWLN